MSSQNCFTHRFSLISASYMTIVTHPRTWHEPWAYRSPAYLSLGAHNIRYALRILGTQHGAAPARYTGFVARCFGRFVHARAYWPSTMKRCFQKRALGSTSTSTTAADKRRRVDAASTSASTSVSTSTWHNAHELEVDATVDGRVRTLLKEGYCVDLVRDGEGRPWSRPQKEQLWARAQRAMADACVYQVVPDPRRTEPLKPNEVLAKHPNAHPKVLLRFHDPPTVALVRKSGWLRLPPSVGEKHFGPANARRLRHGAPSAAFVPSPELTLSHELHQPAAATAVLAAVARHGACVLQAPTGCGKTIVALYCASQWGRRTIIVVHKTDILRQWVQTLARWFPTARVGVIQGKRTEVRDRDVVVAMVQTLVRRDLCAQRASGVGDDKEHRGQGAVEDKRDEEGDMGERADEDERADLSAFGTVIFDEAHHLNSTWGRLLFPLHCAHSLALSATPSGAIMHWWFPTIAYTFKRSAGHTVVHKTTFHGATDASATHPVYASTGTIDFTATCHVLANDAARNTAVCAAIAGQKQRPQPNHVDAHAEPELEREQEPERELELEPTLVLTCFRSHGRTLCEGLRALGVDAGLWLGGMKESEAKSVIDTHRVIVSTYSCAGEGTDIPKLRVLWLTMPRAKVKQPLGRILRGVCKHVGRVYDVVDTASQWGFLSRQWTKRCKEYAEENAIVHPVATRLDSLPATP